MEKTKKALGLALAVTSAFAISTFADVSVSLVSDQASTVNLTQAGDLDWISLGYIQDTGIFYTNQMAEAEYISDVSGRTGGFGGGTGSHTEMWSNGSPVVSTNGIMGQWESTDASALTFSVDNLAAGEYELTVYGQMARAAGTLAASVAGGTVSAASQTGTGNKTSVYGITFDIENAGDSLDVAFAVDSARFSWSNVGIAAITLTTIPEPATLGLITAFGGGILFIRRRFMI